MRQVSEVGWIRPAIVVLLLSQLGLAAWGAGPAGALKHQADRDVNGSRAAEFAVADRSVANAHRSAAVTAGPIAVSSTHVAQALGVANATSRAIGRVARWYSSNGLTMRTEVIAPSGTVVGEELDTDKIVGVHLIQTQTAVFDTQHAWATYVTEQYCANGCSADAKDFPSPAFIRSALAQHHLVQTSSTMSLNGRLATKLVAPGAASGTSTQLWVNLSDDEVLRQVTGPTDDPKKATTTNFQWIAGTPKDEKLLTLSVPTHYRSVQSSYAETLVPVAQSIPTTAHAELVACANSSIAGTVSSDATFSVVGSGTTDGVGWKLWFANADGMPAFAFTTGEGNDLSCFTAEDGPGNPQAGYDLQVAQLPDRPVAFLVGDVTTSAVTKIDATIDDVSKVLIMKPLPGFDARYVLTEFSGMGCSAIESGESEGLTISVAESAQPQSSSSSTSTGSPCSQ